MQAYKTQYLSNDAAGYAKAAKLLDQGGLVSFPTETVYGLGADARNDTAVAKIFEAKGRPSFNPLIVHVANVEEAQRYVVWNDQADRLSAAFWPGALTLVLPLRSNSGISRLVSAGLPTLAVRIPAHPVAQVLLETFNGPIAAPSANPSGRISPTSAAHVKYGLDGKIDAILDGGPCGVGLESTIIGLFEPPKLLRPGGVPVEVIEAALGQPVNARSDDDLLTAPGQMTSHYAPLGYVRLNAVEGEKGEFFLGFGNVASDLNLSPSGDLVEAAANLFDALHVVDASGATKIAVSPIPMTGIGRAINDRLARAAAPRD